MQERVNGILAETLNASLTVKDLLEWLEEKE